MFEQTCFLITFVQGRLYQVRGPSHKGLCGAPQTAICLYLMYLLFQLDLEYAEASQRQSVGSYLLVNSSKLKQIQINSRKFRKILSFSHSLDASLFESNLLHSILTSISVISQCLSLLRFQTCKRRGGRHNREKQDKQHFLFLYLRFASWVL